MIDCYCFIKKNSIMQHVVDFRLNATGSKEVSPIKFGILTNYPFHDPLQKI